MPWTFDRQPLPGFHQYVPAGVLKRSPFAWTTVMVRWAVLLTFMSRAMPLLPLCVPATTRQYAEPDRYFDPTKYISISPLPFAFTLPRGVNWKAGSSFTRE